MRGHVAYILKRALPSAKLYFHYSSTVRDAASILHHTQTAPLCLLSLNRNMGIFKSSSDGSDTAAAACPGLPVPIDGSSSSSNARGIDRSRGSRCLSNIRQLHLHPADKIHFRGCHGARSLTVSCSDPPSCNSPESARGANKVSPLPIFLSHSEAPALMVTQNHPYHGRDPLLCAPSFRQHIHRRGRCLPGTLDQRLRVHRLGQLPAAALRVPGSESRRPRTSL